jgi:hypothetical protein
MHSDSLVRCCDVNFYGFSSELGEPRIPCNGRGRFFSKWIGTTPATYQRVSESWIIMVQHRLSSTVDASRHGRSARSPTRCRDCTADGAFLARFAVALLIRSFGHGIHSGRPSADLIRIAEAPFGRSLD